MIAYNLGNLWRRLALPKQDRQLVADQLAAAAGENRRTVDQARTLLLAAAGGEPSDAAAVCRHAAEDRGAAVAGGIGGLLSATDFGDEIGRQRDKCPRISSETRQLRVSYVSAMQNWSVAVSWKASWTKNRAKLWACKQMVLV